MDNSCLDFQKNKNRKLLKLENKEKYYFDLLNIEHSWSGRYDGNISNTFIMEAEQQLINSIELFELGYFDCAYYALRTSIEISTVMVFLVDMPDTEREAFQEAWKSTKEFPIQGQMIKQLSSRGSIFSDMLEKMSEFFQDAKTLIAKINKHVHKQGLQHFYVARNHQINFNKTHEKFIETYEYYLKKCIGVVAVMRLAIDPFPILLMDEDILYRSFPSITSPYSSEFVDEYIGSTVLDQYKETEIYLGTYRWIKENRKKNQATFDVTNFEYIDSSKIKLILDQFELLSIYDRFSVLLVAANSKIVKTYCLGGILMYFTDKKTNRIEFSWASSDFNNFSKSKKLFNQSYGAAYISVFTFNDEIYFVEHNEKFNEKEVEEIDRFVNERFRELTVRIGEKT